MTIQTRKPTGKPPWPIMLIAGAEKTGKSFACAVASSSDLIDRTLWVGVGEDDPDEMGALPGVRFEIVEHDGTYRGIVAALTAAAAEPAKTKPNLIVVDSATRLWDLLCDQAQIEANRRAERKGRKVGDDGADITMDLWNTAKQRWAHCVDALRGHTGPSIVTARLEQVTVLDQSGKPTTQKDWKVKAEKSLPYDVGVAVELPRRGEAFLTGVRSVRYQSEKDRTEYPGFTVDKLWRDLGLAEKDATAPRQHAQNDPADRPATEAGQARAALVKLAGERGWDVNSLPRLYSEQNPGEQIGAASAKAVTGFQRWCEANLGKAAA